MWAWSSTLCMLGKADWMRSVWFLMWSITFKRHKIGINTKRKRDDRCSTLVESRVCRQHGLPGWCIRRTTTGVNWAKHKFTDVSPLRRAVCTKKNPFWIFCMSAGLTANACFSLWNSSRFFRAKQEILFLQLDAFHFRFVCATGL